MQIIIFFTMDSYRTILIGFKVSSKNLYYETFLSNFDLLLKKESCNFYCATILKILNWLEHFYRE